VSRNQPSRRPGVLILGPPGAGKTTLALGLCQRFPQLGHFAPRRFLLDEQRRGTKLAARAFAILQHATLLPEEFLVEAVADLEAQGKFRNGFVFEGLPVTVRQGELLREAVLDDPLLSGVAFVLHIPEVVMRVRVETRRTCVGCESAGRAAAATTDGQRCSVCGGALGCRDDDSPERLSARLRAQQREAGAVLSWLARRAEVVHLDGECPVHEVLERALLVVAELMPSQARIC
jgi:adenylate kinase